MSRAPSPEPILTEETTRDAGPPFHDIIPGITVVLRSSDDVDFFVFKSILAKVSDVFRDMFDLPNASPESSSPSKSIISDMASLLSRLQRSQVPSISFFAFAIQLKTPI